MQFPEDVEKAYQAAVEAREHSHSPYSKFAVGAAVKIEGHSEPVSGCNVENASFGATICAERSALVQAVSRFGGAIRPEFIVVVTAEADTTVPCAQCLQVMAEFCADDTKIYLGNLDGLQKLYALKELLPYPFRQFTVKP